MAHRRRGQVWPTSAWLLRAGSRDSSTPKPREFVEGRKHGGGASIRRSCSGSKTKNGPLSHHMSIYSKVWVGCEESTLKVKEGCASRAYPKLERGSCPCTVTS
eukprot:5664111-Pleurochrysis_carterae.AAC.2